jgi:hypothetical protein
MLGIGLARIATRTHWVAAAVLVAVGAPWKILAWPFVIALGGDLVVFYVAARGRAGRRVGRGSQARRAGW